MTQGILSGPEIRKQIELGRITVDPYDPRRINPASIDLTLGTGVSIYRSNYTTHVFSKDPGDGSNMNAFNGGVWNSKEAQEVDNFEMGEKGWLLKPGIGYLLHTAERVTTNHFVPVLDGKSSVGRAFILVHYTAGYGDPGFDGQYTLEVTSLFPIRIYPGMRFCQIRFHTLVGDPLLYTDKGHYTEQAARGAVPSQLHKQFD